MTTIIQNQKQMKKFLPKTSNNSRGFTLIELMVAITIVAVLAVIALSLFSNLQKAGRDTRRKEEIVQIAGALESKKDPNSGKYTFAATDLAKEFPSSSNAYSGTDPSGYPYCVYTWTGVSSTALTPPAAGVISSCVGWTPVSGTIGGVATNGTLTTFANAIIAAGNFGAGTAQEWLICAYLETSATPYCKQSSSGS